MTGSTTKTVRVQLVQVQYYIIVIAWKAGIKRVIFLVDPNNLWVNMYYSAPPVQ